MVLVRMRDLEAKGWREIYINRRAMEGIDKRPQR